MKNVFKKVICIAMILSLAISALIVSNAEEETLNPTVFVDFTTADGFAKWEALAKEYDEKDLINGEYTVHGMKGQVWGKFVEDETDGGFSRYFPLEPLDENGRDKDGKTPVANGDFRMTIELDVPLTGENQFLAFCYRITKGALQSTNNIYFRDAVLRESFEKTKSQIGGSGEFNGNEGFWQPAGLSCTDKWVVKIINLKDLKVEESLKGIRIPIPGRENEFFDIKWLCVFDQADGKNATEMKRMIKAFDVEAYKATQTGGDVTEATAEPTATETPTATEAQTATEAPTDDNADKKSGCGSSVSFGAGIILLAAVPFTFKKKKEN